MKIPVVATIFLFGLFGFGMSHLSTLTVGKSSALTPVPYEKPIPSYAKWGELALSETKARYPNLAIVDYLHVGREGLSPTTAMETFKLWLRGKHREFGVYVGIVFDSRTDKLIKVTFQETDQ